MRVKTFSEAVRLANSVGLDAAKARMRKAGRSVMSESDLDHAVSVANAFLEDLGFGVNGWINMAGRLRNEPDDPPPAPRAKSKASPKRRRTRAPAAHPDQLSFAFA